MDQPYRDYDRAFRLVLGKKCMAYNNGRCKRLEREENQ